MRCCAFVPKPPIIILRQSCCGILIAGDVSLFQALLVQSQTFTGWASGPFFICWISIVMELRVLLESTLAGLGYELVDLELARGGLMRLFIDSPAGITLDDCVKVSNHLTRLFMVENVDYERLEVSSPGLDRPLTKSSDFERFAGQPVKLKLRLPQDGARRISGVLQGLDGEVIRVESDGKLIEVPLSNLDKARLDPKF
ncbi:MAG: hypothetical protein RL210_2443 [Pseudomonadota bacterium]|jgi:ribosome maturation factor RimP|nr:ribosome maturation factor RimP [Pseudomonadota bacterium]